VRQRFDQLRALTTTLVAASKDNTSLAYWVADDYLRLVTMALLAWAGARIAGTLQANPVADAPRWQAPLQALTRWVLPEFAMRAGIIASQWSEVPRP
jgi:hypothetical protein